MREATVTAAVPLTLGVAGLGGLYVALTWDRPHRLGLAVLFVLSVAGTMPFYRMREALVRSPYREAFFLSWTLSDFAMLVVATLADGGTRSPLVLVFFIPVVFSAMSYPLASVATVGTVSVLSYLAVALIAGGSSLAYEVGFAFVLLCTAGMSAWQADRHKRQHRALATASRTDQLTGCLNRRGFEERANADISSMRRRGRTGALVVLDIDRFKPVNDVFGHAAGDALLCWVVQTLSSSLRPGDAIGRLGGDEFAALLPETDPEQARTTASRISEALALRAPASLGISFYPEDGTELETLTRCADVRLYQTRRARYGDGNNQLGPGGPRDPAAAELPGSGSSLGAIGLWRAALDAIPARGARGGAQPEQGSLESALLDQIDASVIATDMGGRVISWNQGAQALYGWSSEEAVGRKARELVVPEDAAAAEALMVEVSAQGRWDGELLVRRKDGSLFTVYVRNRLVLDENGEPSAVVGVAVDISARVAAETELLQSRDYAQAVTECMGEGLFTLDGDGRITYVNRAAETLLGRPEEQLRGQLVNEAIYAPHADGSVRALHECPIARALRREVTVRVEEDSFRTRSDRELPVAYTATPFHTDAALQGCVVIFQDISERKHREEEHRRDADTLAIINRVEDALANERFVLHAQPIVDLRTGRTVQHELLLRMRDRDGAVIPPGEFLPVAEQYALIGEIDWWVIKEATRLAGAGSPVQANISARSVGDPDVLEHIERCIEQCRVAPGKLIFEITETAIAEDQQAARTFAERVHLLGCRIALDDFGTGYGSLTYLKQMRVDYLKLDIEFVRDLVNNEASRHVVQAVVALARDFHLDTVGEGVEDAETLQLLRSLGVDFAQGYHLGRPAPFGEKPGDGAQPAPAGEPATKRTEPRRVPPRRGKPTSTAGGAGANGALTVR